MSNFAKIKKIVQYEKVSYYSIIREDEKLSLLELFINKHQIDNKEKLNHIFSWLEAIGEKFGARKEYFRNEAQISDTSALPPLGTEREPFYIEDDEITPNNLRLYCCRLNERVVFLFNGAIKTADTAQNCENVRPHFYEANKLTKSIDQNIKEKGIIWNEDCSDIIFNEELDIEY